MSKKSILTNNGLKGGMLKGKPHYDSNGNPLGGIKAIVTDQGGKPVELEGNEVIVNKKTVQSDKVLTVKGTPKEILSTLNQMDGNGVAIGDEEAEILAKYKSGGKIPTDINKLSLNEFEKYLEEKYNSKVELGDYKKYIYLSRIEVDKETRNLGIGSEIMSEIIDYADYNDKKIALTPSTDYGASSVSRLKDFYKKFGFVENKGRNKDFEISQLMYRVPDSDEYKTGGELITYKNKYNKKYGYSNNESHDLEEISNDTGISIKGLQEIYNKGIGAYKTNPTSVRPSVKSKEQWAMGRVYSAVMGGKASIVDKKELKMVDKYHLGGDMSKHLAPNGKPSNLNHEQWHLVRTPEFKKWFGDWEKAYETGNYDNVSKVIDEETKEPLVVYHGTSKDFNIFEKEKIGKQTKAPLSYLGFFFTDNKNVAKGFTKTKFFGNKERKGAKILDFFLNIRNIKRFTIYETIQKFNKIEKTILLKNDMLQSGIDGIVIDKAEEDWEIRLKEFDGQQFIAFESNQIKLADGTNTTFDANNDDIRFEGGGSISKMTPSELKEFYASPEGKKLDAQTYTEWKRLVNMTKSELKDFYNSEEGKEAGLTQKQANEQGIDSGRESARWIMKMKDIPYKEWTSNMWIWAKKQISFIKRMSGVKGGLYDEKGNKTRKHTALLIWGHNPEKKFAEGGGIENKDPKTYEEIREYSENILKEFNPRYSAYSDTNGQSMYFNVGSYENPIKVRFSDHSVTNIDRISNEVHFSLRNVNSEYTKFMNEQKILEIRYRLGDKNIISTKREMLMPSGKFLQGFGYVEKLRGGGSIEENKNMNKKEIFYARTSGKKYEIKAYDNLTYETFKNGSSNGGGIALDKEDLKYRLDRMIKGASAIDGIEYLIVMDDILEKKEYDFNDYYSVKDLTKSLIEKYNSEVDPKGKKNKGTKINIEARIDSLYRLVNENPSKYLEDFIDFNNELPKSFNISSYLIFQKDDYSNNEGIINYLVESKKNPFEFYDIVPYKLPKTKNFKVSPNDSVFMGIHDEFIGNDALRPILTGTYFSEKGVVSTNAHVLLFTKNRGGEDKFEGVYCHTKKCIEENKDGKIEGKFPNYEAVIPSSEQYSKNINAEYLLTYLKNANKYKIFNSVTHATVFTFETSEGFYKIGANTQFLASCIEAMIELGHKELSLNFTDPNRAITITPKGKTNSDARYLDTDFALCMPVKIDLFKDIYVFIYDLDTNCSSYEYNGAIYCFDLEKVERENFKKEIKEVKELKEQLKSELAKGTKHEMEHLETLKKVAEHKITPEEAVVETSLTHIKENPNYYEDLAKMELEALKDKLKSQGYNVTIPSGGNRISVMGYGKGYFNAKKQKADSILSSLKRNGYNAVSKLDADGYYDFWVYADEPKQDLAKMEAENEESIPDLIEGLKVLAESLEGAEKKEIEETIEGLEILLESEDKFAKGGELDNNSMFFEPSKADQEEEKRIMETQFGKNI